jgi:hypothetical protein
LAYSSLAGYQILAGDKAAAESSFGSAKGALEWTDRGDRPSATAMVYRDVSEAFWKMGDRTRAIAVFNEGRPPAATVGSIWAPRQRPPVMRRRDHPAGLERRPRPTRWAQRAGSYRLISMPVPTGSSTLVMPDLARTARL